MALLGYTLSNPAIAISDTEYGSTPGDVAIPSPAPKPSADTGNTPAPYRPYDNVGDYSPPDNFRGIEWGTNISAIKNQMMLVSGSGELKIYSRKTDKLNIGDAKLINIRYGFYKNRLFFVAIKYANYSNFAAIKLTFFQIYGEGRKRNRYMENYDWGTLTPVAIVLDYNDISKEGSVMYLQNAINKEQQEDMKAKSAAGANDL